MSGYTKWIELSLVVAVLVVVFQVNPVRPYDLIVDLGNRVFANWGSIKNALTNNNFVSLITEVGQSLMGLIKYIANLLSNA